MTSALTKQKISRFKSNKRAYYSLIIFLFISLLSLGAEFISNDKPILVKYDGSYHFPLIKRYPETFFGGDFETEADYTDPYVKELINKKGFMIMPPLPYRYDSINYLLPSPPPTPPSKNNILGTDDQARDVFARLLYGLRISLLFGITLTLLSSIIGIMAGAIQGFFGGLTDLIMQRILEIWSGLPMLFILIILANFIAPNFWWLLLIMLAFSWLNLVGPVRAEFLKARKQEYVIAARIAGIKERHIVLKHILPNALIAALTFIPFILSGSIVTLTSLDFLGFGLPPGTASLGELLSQGKNNLSSPWLGITVFITLSFMLTLLIFIGEGIRDTFATDR
jgi:microcin C transport system permease protein